jgi:hypothetical protein
MVDANLRQCSVPRNISWRETGPSIAFRERFQKRSNGRLRGFDIPRKLDGKARIVQCTIRGGSLYQSGMVDLRGFRPQAVVAVPGSVF